MKARFVLPAAAAVLGLGLLAVIPTARAQTTRSANVETYEVDGVHSSVIFRIKHLGVSYVYGRINSPGGQFSFDPDAPGDSRFEIDVEARNVDTNNSSRDNHIRSADFFNAKQFPEISFKSTKVRKRSGDTYEVTGNMTLHGETKPIVVDLDFVGCADDPWGGYRCGFDGTFTIKRSDFGMDFMKGPLGDEVTLMVGLEGKKKKE